MTFPETRGGHLYESWFGLKRPDVLAAQVSHPRPHAADGRALFPALPSGRIVVLVVSPETDLGTFDLEAGESTIGAEIVGANEQAVKAYLFGLDYVRLEAVR